MVDIGPDLPDSGSVAGERGSEDRVARRSFLAESRRALWSLLRRLLAAVPADSRDM